MPSNENAEPNLPKLLNDSDEPTCAQSSTDTAAPTRAKLLSDMVEPKCKKSSTDNEDPNLAMPSKENADAKR
jgi:hypothetical protein